MRMESCYILFIVVLQLHSLVARQSEPLCLKDNSLTKLIEKVDEIDKELKQNTKDLKTIQHHQSGFSPLLDDIPAFYHENPLTVAQLESNGWTMVFRATSGNGHKSYDAWTDGTGTSNVKPVNMARSLSSHYRDPGIDNWSNIQVKYVKFALYKDNREVAFVVFNGRGSTMMNWFSSERVLASSWPSLTAAGTFNVFAINALITRRFHINVSYGGCDGDRGFVAAIDAGPGCDWDNHPKYPQFIYSDLNSDDFYNRRLFGRADYLAVFVYV